MAERQQAGRQTSLSILKSTSPENRALLPWGGMIRDQADVSPLNLMKIGNETSEKVEKNVDLLHILFHSSVYHL